MGNLMGARASSTPDLERLAAVEQRLSDHEARCEERLAEIRATAASTLKAVEGLKSRFWTITLALLAWAMAQMWSANQARLSLLEQSAPHEIRAVAAR
ncbi:MAG: hypothetical protein JSR98_00435 [Proteobacteria bacterium]|nr:hypothetical protein [Pseudomonadota bacterium]